MASISRSTARPIFRGLDIAIRRGEVTAIMGPSGTGKTTLLRLITGQLRAGRGPRPRRGSRRVRHSRRRELYALRRRMGMLFQNGALLTDLDVFENVAFPLREHTQLPERLVRNIVLTKLQAVGPARRRRAHAASSSRAAWGGASRWHAPSSWTRSC